jgi:hypothetical protein
MLGLFWELDAETATRRREETRHMRNRLALGLAAALLGGAPTLAFAQTPVQPPIINRGGGIAGTGLGAGAGAAGAQTTEPVVANRARSPAMISGTAHIGAGTGGLGLGMGNATGGINATAYGAGSGGIGDGLSWGSNTGGVRGVGRGLGAGTGGIQDQTALGINTGGVQGSPIGAGTGGLKDLNSLGASTGGSNEGANAPRYRVVQ